MHTLHMCMFYVSANAWNTNFIPNRLKNSEYNQTLFLSFFGAVVETQMNTAFCN